MNLQQIQDYAAAMLPHYLECAYWTNEEDLTDEGGEGASFSIDAEGGALIDCQYFVAKANPWFDGLTPEQAGHDLWLTRNGHGAGFWDRDELKYKDILTEICRVMGEAYLFVNDHNELDM